MDALELGIETLYQDLALAENLNVYSNIFLGREKTKPFLGFIPVLDHEAMHAESSKVLKRLEIEIPSLRSQIKNLSGGQRQAVAISRSIYWNARLLIMDEPTAALGVAGAAQGAGPGAGPARPEHPRDRHQPPDVRHLLRDRPAGRSCGAGRRWRRGSTKDTTPDEVVGLIIGSEEVERNDRPPH